MGTDRQTDPPTDPPTTSAPLRLLSEPKMKMKFFEHRGQNGNAINVIASIISFQ